MSKTRFFVFTVILIVSLLLAACVPSQRSGEDVPTAVVVQPTDVPAISPAVLANPSSTKVGLVTDIHGVNDQAFNQMAWEGMQKASSDFGFQVQFLESTQPSDFENNIEAFTTGGFNIIITVGPMMGDATILKARQYPNVRFVIIDNPNADENLPNLNSLMFAEDQVGFLAGILAGGMSKSGFVCSISSLRNPRSDRFVKSYHAGATWQAGPDLMVMNNYINIQTSDENVPTHDDFTQGKETANYLFGQGCDVVFALGGEEVMGVLLAAKENNLPAIGADVDEYNIHPEVQSALMTSAMKNANSVVYNYLKSVAQGSVLSENSMGTLQNGGVGLAPFHDWDGLIPADLKVRIQEASDGIMNGSIQTDH